MDVVENKSVPAILNTLLKKKIKPSQPLEVADSLDIQSLSTEQPWKVLMKCLVHTA